MTNGSEHTPERCVHAPEGPDWAGLWELPTPKPDCEALKAWDERERFFAENGFPEQTDYHRGVSYIGFMAGWKARDALRTQLDSMTVEWATVETDSAGNIVLVAVWGDEQEARTAYDEGYDGVVSRLVSPWTVVEGDDQ